MSGMEDKPPLSASRQETSAGIPVPQYLTAKQAAPLAAMSREAIYKRVGTRNGPAYVRRGRRIFLLRDEFLVWVTRQIIP
jgi:hypothetical protein